MDDKGDEEGEGMTKEEVEILKKKWRDQRRGGETKEEVDGPKKRWRDQRRGGETKEERGEIKWRNGVASPGCRLPRIEIETDVVPPCFQWHERR